MRSLTLLFSFSFWLLLACDSTPTETATENQYMLDLLEERHADVRALDITYYYNAKRAAAYDSLRQRFKRSFDDYVSYSYWYVRETMNSGNTEKAILEIEKFRNELASESKALTPQWDYFFKRLEAVAYIRLGEQTNCLINHTAASCILPVAGDGVHIDPSGSQRAIEIIEPLLKDYPEDLELVWLLNLCYQTIGAYPHGVPKSYLIPEKAFASKSLIDRFEDYAPQLNVAVSGIAGGSIMEDFTGDGYLDLVVTSSGFTPEDQMRFFVNDGKGGFIDRTKEAGLTGLVGGLNCQQTDYNNDGLIDIFVLRGGWFGPWGKHPNSLLRNNGDGTFTDVTREAGLLSFNPTQTAAWADFNKDGWLDVFIGNESFIPPGMPKTADPKRVHRAEFYLNQGDGTFKNVAADLGLDFIEMIKGVVAFDANNDQLTDLYLSVNQGENIFLMNRGNLKFENVAKPLGMLEPIESFPVAAFDYNNDGFEDLLVCGYTSTGKPLPHEFLTEMLGNEPVAALPRLYENNGDGTFTDVTALRKMKHTIYGMGFNYGDLNNDGYLDIYFGTGDPNFESIIPNRMFLNMGGKYFEEVTYEGGFSNIQKGHGVSWGDIDNDGDEDVYITMGGAHEGDVYQNQLLINPLKNTNWINISLEGKTSNKVAIGTRVQITTSTGQQIFRVVSSGASFGANSYRLEVGLGTATSISELKVTWPATGEQQLFKNVGVNQFVKIIEGKAELQPITITPVQWSGALPNHSAKH
ncbi:CRTAC1 family protein [Roseivirga sp. UBA838]|uniref:CRTAC1 family protein n=1 Tax=Roseivirga sp. UBA838 TaxID=1947393 RepID=UPI002580D25D|nr:CRTAC1 family protein [Roseivirga sp. UBA838]